MNKDSKMLAEAYSKICSINEDKNDRKGKRCEKCKRGTYGEGSMHDDLEGKITCNKCGDRQERYKA